MGNVLLHLEEGERLDINCTKLLNDEVRYLQQSRELNVKAVKPWPNVKTSDLLVTLFASQALRVLALTCDGLRSLWSRSNLPTQVDKATQVSTQVQLAATYFTITCESVRPILYYSILDSGLIVGEACTALLSANSRKVSGKFPIVIVQSEEIPKKTLSFNEA